MAVGLAVAYSTMDKRFLLLDFHVKCSVCTQGKFGCSRKITVIAGFYFAVSLEKKNHFGIFHTSAIIERIEPCETCCFFMPYRHLLRHILPLQ